MTTKEEEFKQRFVAVLRDLQANGSKDAETMWLIGSLAANLVDRARVPSWKALKLAMTRDAYDNLLRDFQTEGNALHQQGKARHVYAIQVLGLSLIARTQIAPEMQTGDELLNGLIDLAVAVYRKSALRGNKLN